MYMSKSIDKVHNNKNWTWSVWWCGGFLRIFILVFDRLFQVRLGKDKGESANKPFTPPNRLGPKNLI